MNLSCSNKNTLGGLYVFNCFWLWLGCWFLCINFGSWSKNLMNLKWLEPVDSCHTPEACPPCSDKTESFERHLCRDILHSSVHELIGWCPLSEGTCELPIEFIVGCFTWHAQFFLSYLISLFIDNRGSDCIWFTSILEGICDKALEFIVSLLSYGALGIELC